MNVGSRCVVQRSYLHLSLAVSYLVSSQTLVGPIFAVRMEHAWSRSCWWLLAHLCVFDPFVPLCMLPSASPRKWGWNNGIARANFHTVASAWLQRKGPFLVEKTQGRCASLHYADYERFQAGGVLLHFLSLVSQQFLFVAATLNFIVWDGHVLHGHALPRRECVTWRHLCRFAHTVVLCCLTIALYYLLCCGTLRCSSRLGCANQGKRASVRWDAGIYLFYSYSQSFYYFNYRSCQSTSICPKKPWQKSWVFV